MVPPCSDRISRVPPYSRIKTSSRIRGYHPLWPDFPDRSASPVLTTGLFRVRSPLLAESLLMSVPPGTEMFQFPGFASNAYVFSARYPIGVGCPIRTSTDQSLLAAPRGFSQRATSFIASWCQGIHRMPFSCSMPAPRHHNEGATTTPHRNHPRIRRQVAGDSRQENPRTSTGKPPPPRNGRKSRRKAALLSTHTWRPTVITTARPPSNAPERRHHRMLPPEMVAAWH